MSLPAAATTSVPDRAEVIYIENSPHAGIETPGLHPMRVCSTRAFGERTGIAIGFPMTHSSRHANNPFAVKVEGPVGEVGYVVANQAKSLDWHASGARPHPWGGGHTAALVKHEPAPAKPARQMRRSSLGNSCRQVCEYFRQANKRVHRQGLRPYPRIDTRLPDLCLGQQS